MVKTFVENLNSGDFVQSTFLVTRLERRLSRDQKPYLQLSLEDRSGMIDGRVWDDVDALETRFEVEDFVAVRGQVEEFGGRTYLTIGDLEKVADEDISPDDYFPASRWNAEALFNQLMELIETSIQSPEVLSFLHAIFADQERVAQFKFAPAAMKNHHAFRSGLLEHCLSMCRLALRISEHYQAYYPGMVNSDLVVAGCILHDIGKCEELEFKRKTQYSTSGRLVGHISIGAAWVDEFASKSELPIPESLVLHLKHLVLSHHGKQEYGSPITPKTAEAIVLHEVDMIDSRLNMCWNLRGSDLVEDTWSDYSRALEGPIHFRGDSTWEKTKAFDPQDLTGPGSIELGAELTTGNLDLFGNPS